MNRLWRLIAEAASPNTTEKRLRSFIDNDGIYRKDEFEKSGKDWGHARMTRLAALNNPALNYCMEWYESFPKDVNDPEIVDYCQSCSREDMLRHIYETDMSRHRFLSENNNISEDMMRTLLKENREFFTGIVKNPNTPKDILMENMFSGNDLGIAKHPNTDKGMLAILALHDDTDVRQIAMARSDKAVSGKSVSEIIAADIQECKRHSRKRERVCRPSAYEIADILRYAATVGMLVRVPNGGTVAKAYGYYTTSESWPIFVFCDGAHLYVASSMVERDARSLTERACLLDMMEGKCSSSDMHIILDIYAADEGRYINRSLISWDYILKIVRKTKKGPIVEYRGIKEKLYECKR